MLNQVNEIQAKDIVENIITGVKTISYGDTEDIVENTITGVKKVLTNSVVSNGYKLDVYKIMD